MEECPVKKAVRSLFPLAAALSLTTAAHADAIAATPAQIAGSLVNEFLPWLLVAAVVVVTVILLVKFRKKK